MGDFFSGSKPDLISMKSINDLTANVFINSSQEKNDANGNTTNKPTIITNPSNITNPLNIKTFFLNYIKPNILPIIIILLFIGFLVFRYLSYNENNNDENNNEKFNPTLPIKLQTDKMEYPTAGLRPPKYPDDKNLEISVDDVFEKMKRKHGPPYVDDPQYLGNADLCEFENPENRETNYVPKYINTSSGWINQIDNYGNISYNDYLNDNLNDHLIPGQGNFVQFEMEKNKKLDDLAKKIFN